MDDLISRQALYEQTAEWEAQALHMIEKLMHSKDPDADALKEWKKWSVILQERTAFKHDVADAPSVDAVPVVRCKDCKYHENESPGMVYCPEQGGGWVRDDFFCTDGERWDDETH